MIKILISLVSLLLIRNSFAGCGNIRFTTNTGIFLSHHAFDAPYRVDIVAITVADSIVLTAKIDGSCLFLFNLYFENKNISNGSRFKNSLTFAQRPGTYEVFGETPYSKESYTFTLVQNLVGVNELEALQLNLRIFPNPVDGELSLINEPEGIKNIFIYDCSGELIKCIEVSAMDAQIDMGNYPAGVYFVQVATLTEKILFRKITVL